MQVSCSYSYFSVLLYANYYNNNNNKNCKKDDRVELEDDMHLLSLLNSLNLQ